MVRIQESIVGFMSCHVVKLMKFFTEELKVYVLLNTRTSIYKLLVLKPIIKLRFI